MLGIQLETFHRPLAGLAAPYFVRSFTSFAGDSADYSDSLSLVLHAKIARHDARLSWVDSLTALKEYCCNTLILDPFPGNLRGAWKRHEDSFLF